MCFYFSEIGKNENEKGIEIWRVLFCVLVIMVLSVVLYTIFILIWKWKRRIIALPKPRNMRYEDSTLES